MALVSPDSEASHPAEGVHHTVLARAKRLALTCAATIKSMRLNALLGVWNPSSLLPVLALDSLLERWHHRHRSSLFLSPDSLMDIQRSVFAQRTLAPPPRCPPKIVCQASFEVDSSIVTSCLVTRLRSNCRSWILLSVHNPVLVSFPPIKRQQLLHLERSASIASTAPEPMIWHLKTLAAFLALRTVRRHYFPRPDKEHRQSSR